MLQIFVKNLSRKHDEMPSIRLNNGFRLQKTNRAASHWKQPSKKSFHRVSRGKILHDSWSISAALASPNKRKGDFERGEGPGEEVDKNSKSTLFETPGGGGRLPQNSIPYFRPTQELLRFA